MMEKFFVLELCGRRYALAPAHVEEVTPPVKPLPIPTVPRHFRGVIHLRGRILPVVDGRILLGLDAGDVTSDEAARMVVLCAGGQRWVVVADRVLGLREVRADSITHAAEPPVAGRFELPEGAVVLLDGASLTQAVREVRS
jgi:purine-binding chemotaxis protein CheW